MRLSSTMDPIFYPHDFLKTLNKDVGEVFVLPALSAEIALTARASDPSESYALKKLLVRVEYDFNARPEGFGLLMVKSNPPDLSPYVSVEPPDSNNRADGVGAFVRPYALRQEVKLEAPEWLGNYRFTHWAVSHEGPSRALGRAVISEDQGATVHVGSYTEAVANFELVEEASPTSTATQVPTETPHPTSTAIPTATFTPPPTWTQTGRPATPGLRQSC